MQKYFILAGDLSNDIPISDKNVKATAGKLMLVETEKGAAIPSGDSAANVNVAVQVTPKPDIGRKVSDTGDEFVKLGSCASGHYGVVSLNVDSQFSSLHPETVSANGHSDIVHLLQATVDPNIAELTNEQSALYSASASGHADIVDMLLSSGVSPNIKATTEGATPLHAAAYGNHTEVVKALLDSNLVNVNAQDSKLRFTALHVAAKGGSSKVVALLLEAKADPNICDQDGATAIMYASAAGHSDVVELLLQAKADPNVAERANRETALCAASANGHANIVGMLLRSGADPNITTISQGTTPLHVAAYNNHVEIVKALVNSQLADGNARDSKLQSTVSPAIKADPNICDKNGATALMHASANGCSDIVELLLQAKADPNIVERTVGGTALYVASTNGHANVVKMLLRSGADPIITSTSEGATPLHVAAQCNHIEVVNALLNSRLADVNAGKGCRELLAPGAKADPNICDKKGATALMRSSANGCSEIVELLLQADADTNIVESTVGVTALYAASANGHANIVELLLKSGADPNITSASEGATPLHAAAHRDHIVVVNVLLNSSSVDVNVQDRSQNRYTALHVASSRGHAAAVESLLDANADPNIVDALGQSPLTVATKGGHTHIAKLLLHKNA